MHTNIASCAVFSAISGSSVATAATMGSVALPYFDKTHYNQRMVLQSSQITLIAPAKTGMRLVAEATERHRAERSAIYDVRVRAPDGSTIAEFRGHVRSIPGTLIPGTT